MRLLFITQKTHGQDAFVRLWVKEFQRRGYIVTVLCLEASPDSSDIHIVSMGKEKGRSRLVQVLHFWKHIVTLKYDRVFIHMSPVWYALGFWWWLLRRVPCYLWYTHYKMQLGVRLFGLFGKRFFCATAQSLPQFAGNPKKVVTGHGVDLGYWTKMPNRASDPHQLLMVHRLSRSKRVELVLHALAFLPSDYTLDIYGIEAEPDYVAELRDLVQSLGLQSRVAFKGTVPMAGLREVYPRHCLILNMASETIDKTMLEAMTCGCYPVTMKRNAEAIGLRPAFVETTAGRQGYGRQVGFTVAPAEDTPEAVATFIQNFRGADHDELYLIVQERHSLEGMVKKMDEYMSKGI